MRKYIVFLLSLLQIAVGCSTNSRCRLELYQSRLECVGAEEVILRLLDRGEPQKAHEFAASELVFRLDDLRKLAKGADKEQLKTAADLARLILKNADENRERLIQEKYSLQLVIECKSMVTNITDIQRASELEHYLASSTNQVTWPVH